MNEILQTNVYNDWNQIFLKAKGLRVRTFNTGLIQSDLKSYTQPSNGWADEADKRMDYSVNFFCISHPVKGDILIDSGFDDSFRKRTFGSISLLPRIFYALNGVQYTQNKDQDIRSHLDKNGIQPSYVFLTHMHPDHTGGIPALPSHVKVCHGKGEKNLYYRLLAGKHLRAKKNMEYIDFSKSFSMGPFDRVIDLFQDQSLFAISTPGHTRDHVAYFINCRSNPTLVMGDAELNPLAMKKGWLVSSDYGKKGRKEVQASSGKIGAFLKKYPQVQGAFSHG